jgi:hypothetical protein
MANIFAAPPKGPKKQRKLRRWTWKVKASHAKTSMTVIELLASLSFIDLLLFALLSCELPARPATARRHLAVQTSKSIKLEIAI